MQSNNSPRPARKIKPLGERLAPLRERLRNIPVLDDRPANSILYGPEGLSMPVGESQAIPAPKSLAAKSSA